jgi:hypothetical protein
VETLTTRNNNKPVIYGTSRDNKIEDLEGNRRGTTYYGGDGGDVFWNIDEFRNYSIKDFESSGDIIGLNIAEYRSGNYEIFAQQINTNQNSLNKEYIIFVTNIDSGRNIVIEGSRAEEFLKTADPFNINENLVQFK